MTLSGLGERHSLKLQLVRKTPGRSVALRGVALFNHSLGLFACRGERVACLSVTKFSG